MTTKAETQFNYSGAAVLVTGGTQGIGYAIATAYREAGANVTITGTRMSANDYDNDNKDNDLKGFNYLTMSAQDKTSIASVANSLTKLDILINNAGASLPGGKDEWEADVFEESVRINLFSAFHMSQACLPLLKSSPLASASGASVIGIASMTSFFGNSMVPGYGAAKAGLVQLSKTLSQTWADHGIRVNAIAAGLIETRMTQPVKELDFLSKPLLERTPLKRFGQPDEIAQAALFLSSAQASFITGQTLCVDGGFSIAG